MEGPLLPANSRGRPEKSPRDCLLVLTESTALCEKDVMSVNTLGTTMTKFCRLFYLRCGNILNPHRAGPNPQGRIRIELSRSKQERVQSVPAGKNGGDPAQFQLTRTGIRTQVVLKCLRHWFSALIQWKHRSTLCLNRRSDAERVASYP